MNFHSIDGTWRQPQWTYGGKGGTHSTKQSDKPEETIDNGWSFGNEAADGSATARTLHADAARVANVGTGPVLVHRLVIQFDDPVEALPISALQSESFSRGVPEPAPKQRRSPPRATGVTRHLALNEVQPTEPGLASLAIALDSATVACMETHMRVVQVHERRGTQLECRLSPQASEAFGRRPEAGEILGAEREVSEGFGPRAVSCWQIEEPGRFLIEFAPSANGIPAAYRDHFRVCILGDVGQDRKENDGSPATESVCLASPPTRTRCRKSA